MAEENLPTWPNEGKINRTEEIIDSITWPKKAEISKNLQDVDTMEADAEEINLSAWTRFDEAVNILLKKKAEGLNCFINFNWKKLYSVDINSMDDAYIKCWWMTKAEDEERSRKQAEAYRISEEQRRKREEWYVKKIDESREWLEEVKITKENVVAGLKFIAEHPDMEHDQLVDELIKLGCNFSFDDIDKQFPEKVKLFPGMKNGHLWCGASVIANMMRSEFSRSYYDDRFLSGDYPESVYAFIRKVTDDETYTKEYVDSLVKKEK